MAHRYEAWFPHDANAHSDPKLQAVISDFGWEGIGWYWDILARLRMAPNHAIEWDRPYIQMSLAGHFRTDVERILTFVERLLNDFDLLVLENGFLRSKGMDSNMKEFDAKRQQASLAGIASGEKRRKTAISANGSSTGVQREFNGVPTDVEQIRVDKKERTPRVKIISSVPPNREDVFSFAEKIQRAEVVFNPPYLKDTAIGCVDEFIDHYTANGWKVGRNNMKDWQATFTGWIRRQAEFKKDRRALPQITGRNGLVI
jgi:hypothetical protein